MPDNTASQSDRVQVEIGDVPLDEQARINDETGAEDAAKTTFSQRHPVIVFTVLRAALLFVALGICYALGARGILLLLLAFLTSGLASFIFLVPQRDRVGRSVGGYFSKMNSRIEQGARSEDDLIDAHEFDEHETHDRDSDPSATEEDTDGRK